METPTDKALVTRFCRLNEEDGTLRSEYNNFPWPRSGPVEAPDWSPVPECGKGLHGWLWGKGIGGVWNHNPSDVMLVVEVDQQDIVDLEGKVKFPKGNVILAGTREEVTKYMAERGHVGILYGDMTVGNQKIAEVGDFGNATAGNHSTATAGDFGTAEACYYGTAVAGYGGHAAAGDSGTATAGDHGTAVAGKGGIAIAGVYGKARAGKHGKAQAGEGGRIEIEWYNTRNRIAVGYIGENGLKPDTLYRVDAQGNFVEV